MPLRAACLLLALTLSCALQSLAQPASPDAAPSPRPPSASAPSGAWKLASLGGAPLNLAPNDEPRRPGLEFAPGTAQAYGQSGCNRFHGAYALDENGLRFQNMATTRMACPGPLMELEQRYLDMLGQTRQFRLEEGRLLLLAGDGQPLAVFEPK